VLVVEDDRDSRDMLELTLALAKVDVRGCGSVRDCLETLASWRPDVIVTDIGLPDEDGYALVRQLRSSADEWVRRLPVVALTGFARASDRDQALAEGFDAHLSKPLEAAALLAAVVPLVRGRDAGDVDARG
jgi:CheY-like chemotaxis protein